MRKLLFSITVLTVFLLSGCDLFDIKDILEDIPVLEVVGDMDVTIGLNEEYVDPGVNLLGDFDLEINTESNLDITTYGIYYIYYSAEFAGELYTAERRIRVVPDTEKDFNIEISVVSEDPNALTFSIELSDEEGLLRDGKATLYLLDEKISEFPISGGTNVLEFTGLSNFTYYLLVFEGSYTDNEIEYTLNDYNIGAKTTFIDPADYPRLELVGDEEIYLNVGDTYVEQGVTITKDYDAEVTIDSNVDTSEAGTYEVTYSIVFNETTIYAHRTVIVEESDDIDFGISIEVIETNPYSLVISVTVDDENGLITSPRGILYLGDDKVQEFIYASGTTTMTFERLLSNTMYKFVLEGAYQEDGEFVSIGEYSVDVTTQEVNFLQPILILEGDSVMDVVVNTTFVDPGASVIGDSGAIITTTSSLDMSVVDTYVITYNTVINDMTQSVTRTVNVINAEPIENNVPVISLTSYEIGIEFLDTVIKVEDENSQIISLEAIIYDNTEYQELVWMLTIGDNPHLFDYLGHEIDYRLIVEYTYIPEGESTPIEASIELLSFTTLAPPKPVLNSIDCATTDTSITCTADWDTTGFSSVGFFAQLWHDGGYESVPWFTDENTTLFIDDLDPDTVYSLRIFADYVVIETSKRYIAEIIYIDDLY